MLTADSTGVSEAGTIAIIGTLCVGAPCMPLRHLAPLFDSCERPANRFRSEFRLSKLARKMMPNNFMTSLSKVKNRTVEVICSM